MTASKQAYEVDYKREWRDYQRFLKAQDLIDYVDSNSFGKKAVHELFKFMYQKLKVQLPDWNAGNVSLALYRFFNAAYKYELEIDATANVYNSMTTFMIFETHTKRVSFSYDDLHAMMVPIEAEYLLPYGNQAGKALWTPYTEKAILEYTNQWVDEFVTNPANRKLLLTTSADSIRVYLVTFACELYAKERKTLKNTSKRAVVDVLTHHFEGVLLTKKDYERMQSVLPKFFKFVAAHKYMRDDHVKYILDGIEEGFKALIPNLEAHDWFAYPKQRYAQLEKQYENNDDIEWVSEFYPNPIMTDSDFH